MVQKGKKLRYSLFVFVIAFSMLLAGCGGGNKDSKESASSPPETSKAPATADAQASPSASGQTDASQLKPVKLIWYYLGTEDGDTEAVFAAANKIIQSKINATVEFHPMSNADFKAKMPLKVAAGEKFDLTYTADYIFTYLDNVIKGAFLPLDDLIHLYAPQTEELIADDIWDAVKVNGKKYAVPNTQVQNRQSGFLFKKELVDKYNLKDQVLAVKTMEDLTPLFEVIKKNEPGMFGIAVPPNHRKYEVRTKDDYVEQLVIGVPVAVDYNLKVVNLTEGAYKEESLNDYKIAREWAKKGYFHPDAALTKDLKNIQKEGKFFVIEDNFKPGVEADSKQKWGYDVYGVPMGQAVLSTGSISAALTAVSRTSENPERAMMLIELMNTDKELLNLLTFGIEGVDYKKTGDNSIEVIAQKPYAGKAWAMGNQFLAYTLPGQDPDVWEQTDEKNKTALPAPTIGFSFDPTPVKTEFANLTAITEKYRLILGFGTTDDYAKIYEQEIKEYQDAGLQKYMDELQKQLDAWKAAK